MKTPALFLAAFFAVAAPSQGGIVIVQEAENLGGMDGKTELVMTLSDERARVDVGKQLSSIVDTKTGQVVSLMHAQKVAMELPKGALDAVKQKVGAPKDKPDLKPTGKKETINGFACEEYAGKMHGFDVTYWVTQDVANQKEILAQMGKLSGDGDPLKAAMADGGDFPGFPIRTTIKSPQVGTSTVTVVSIKNEEVPASTFETPTDYKKMDLPLPGGGPASPGGN